MKIDICLMSCNDNFKYYSFFPYVKKIWSIVLNIKCILIYVGDDLPELLLPFKDDIIMFSPCANMHHAFIAQNIRLLYPALLNCENGVIIADIDIVPLSRKFFVEQIANISDEKFVYYHYLKICDDIKEYYMCYNVALPKTWSNIFNVSSLDDINILLKKWYDDITYDYNDRYRSKCKGFHNDQIMLYKYVNLYEDKSSIVLLPSILSRLVCNSIKKINNVGFIQDISNDVWHDFHIEKTKFNKKELEILANICSSIY